MSPKVGGEALLVPAEKGASFSVIFQRTDKPLPFYIFYKESHTHPKNLHAEIDTYINLSNCPFTHRKDLDSNKPNQLGPCLVGIAQEALEKVCL